MGRAPLVPLAVAFIIGIASGTHGIGLVELCAGIVLAAVARRVPAHVRAGAIVALALGVFDAIAFGSANQPEPESHVRRLGAVVVDVRAGVEDLVATTLRFADGSVGTVELPAPAEVVGSRLVVRCRRVPFDGPRNPGEPSPRELAAERGLTWRLVHAKIVARAPPDGRDVTLWLPRMRAWASARVHERFPEPEATILAGAMWGERGTLAPDLREEFQETGTVHVLVTAGLHLGVVAAFTVAFLQTLRCGRIGASLGAIVVVWLYAALSGDHLPSVRAATMLSFALAARAAGRETLSWNALAAAAIIVSALRPTSVTTVSFALSFSCVAAIFAFAAPIAEALERIGTPPFVREAIAVALATQLGTWPLTAAAFLVIAPYAPLANALVVPVVGIAMLGGFMTLAFAPIPPLAAIAAACETSLIDWVRRRPCDSCRRFPARTPLPRRRRSGLSSRTTQHSSSPPSP